MTAGDAIDALVVLAGEIGGERGERLLRALDALDPAYDGGAGLSEGDWVRYRGWRPGMPPDGTLGRFVRWAWGRGDGHCGAGFRVASGREYLCDAMLLTRVDGPNALERAEWADRD